MSLGEASFVLCFFFPLYLPHFSKLSVGQRYKEQFACGCCGSPLSFECYNVAIEYNGTTANTYTHTHTHSMHRDRERNHIISPQIINEIIFGCSLRNVSQLDARGNKERETEKNCNKEKCMKERVYGVDETIWKTTEKGKRGKASIAMK